VGFAPATIRVKPLSPGAVRVLELARHRGPRGVHSSDFDVPGQTVDGGKPIRRLAARVDELRNHGHWFEADRQRDRTVRYRLVRDAAIVELALGGSAGVAPLKPGRPRK
jgi:hypothetical protein